jgi:uncharacterized protein YndB with AHSA1/START domain
MEAGSSEVVLEMRRILPALSEVVFDAFCDSSRLAQWWGPRGFSIPSLQVEVREGAPYRIEMQPPDGDSFFLIGEFREVDPPKRLAFTFVWEEPDPDDVETLVELSFHRRAGSTEVALRQGIFKSEERRELHRGGWSDSFGKLEELLT